MHDIWQLLSSNRRRREERKINNNTTDLTNILTDVTTNSNGSKGKGKLPNFEIEQKSYVQTRLESRFSHVHR